MKNFFLLVILFSSFSLMARIPINIKWDGMLCKVPIDNRGICLGTITYTDKWGDKEEYEGEIKNNLPHGTGCYKYSEGSTFCGVWEGECFVDGKIRKYTHNDGSSYEGEYADGCSTSRAGKGKLTEKDGSYYYGTSVEGEWRYINGDIYTGSVTNGLHEAKKNGYGILKSPTSGVTYKGQWKNDLKHGLGSEHNLEGIWKEGIHYYKITNLIREGIWKEGNYIGTQKEVIELENIEIEAQKLYNKIYNACLLDQSRDIDMKVKSLQVAIEEKCSRIAEDPSWLDNLRYNLLN